MSDQDGKMLTKKEDRRRRFGDTGMAEQAARQNSVEAASRELLSNSRRPLVNPSLSVEPSPGKRVEETRPARAIPLCACLTPQNQTYFLVQRFFRGVVIIAVSPP